MGGQIAEAPRMLQRVRIPEARNVPTHCPHQLSRGMRERALIEGEIPSPIRAVGNEPVIQLLVEVGPGHFVARHPIAGDF